MIPLVFAGWLRYLMGVDDNGEKFELSPDPMLSALCSVMEKISLGSTENAEEVLRPILSNEKIFGVDLYKAGLAELVISYFKELTKGPGAVKDTLEKYVKA